MSDEQEQAPAADQPPVVDTIQRDPTTGEPLRDQSVPAKDTGYLGNHDMQDQTEAGGVPEEAKEADFAE